MGVVFQIFGVLAIFWTIFFLIGVSGDSNSSSVVQDVPWYKYETSGCTEYFGLSLATLPCGGVTSTLHYSDCADYSSDCKTCQDNGNVATAFCAIALLFCIPTIWSNYTRGVADTSTAKTVGVVCNFVAFLSAIIAMGAFKTCMDTFNVSETVGSGLALVLVAFFGTLLAFLYNLFIPVGGGSVSFTVSFSSW